MPGEDPYEVLGVPSTASSAEIARAYRQLVRTLHPDARPTDPGAAERFARVTGAYRILIDPAQRAAYDRLRPTAGETTGPVLRGRRIPVNVIGDTTTGDPLGPYPFADSAGWTVPRRRRPGASTRPRPRRGRDVEADVSIDLADAAVGITVTVDLPGSDGTARQIRIPPGVANGQRLRVCAAGDPGIAGGSHGDLYLTVRVNPHPRFGRHGNDLAVTASITFPEAVTGGGVTVPGLYGSPITVEVPAGTRSGDTLRVPGAGMIGPSGIGDLLVTVHIDVPTRLSAAQRAVVDALARVLPDPRLNPKEEP